jgi:hypothetical protein
MRKALAVTVLVLGLAPFPEIHAQRGHEVLKKIAEFDLPGPPGKQFDYLTIDADDHYLISAHLAAGQTYVIDLRTNHVVATVKDTPGAEGVEYVPGIKKFYTSNAGDNTIGAVDLRTMKVIKKLPTERKPDGSAYAAPFHKLYVSDERGKAEAVVDVTKDKIVKTLHFESDTGMPQYDPLARKVYLAGRPLGPPSGVPDVPYRGRHGLFDLFGESVLALSFSRTRFCHGLAINGLSRHLRNHRRFSSDRETHHGLHGTVHDETRPHGDFPSSGKCPDRCAGTSGRCTSGARDYDRPRRANGTPPCEYSHTPGA